MHAAENSGVGLLVGYHLRYAPTVVALAGLVREGLIGTPRTFSFSVGQHLSQWRPGTDPAKSVSAREELGGGVLLELSHELDAVRLILGEVLACSAVLGREGAPTDGLVDTVADLELELDSGIFGHVHLDMVSDVPFRTWSVTGSQGTLTADLLAGSVEVASSGITKLLHKSDFHERDTAEARLIANFFEVALGQGPPLCTGQDGIAALDIIEAAVASDVEVAIDTSGSTNWVRVAERRASKL